MSTTATMTGWRRYDGPPKDAHVKLQQAHLRAESLKAISKKTKIYAGKKVEYASLAAAKSYLHRLGFSVIRKGKSSFVDGHERCDVLESRADF